MSVVDDILVANRAYYEALSARDIEAMARIWTCTSDDINIAPPVRPVTHIGWEKIKENYLSFWNTLSALSVSMENPEVRINGDTAWIHGVETTHRHLKTGGSERGRNAGTSVFVRRAGHWRITFHNATMLP